MKRPDTNYQTPVTKLGARQLRASRPKKSDLAKIKRREIYIICDNILDTYNIGSIFRLADAVAASCVYLCGQTATPPYHRIAKAAVGTEKWVPWQHFPSVNAAISNIKSQISNIKVVAIEQSARSIDYRKADLSEPVAFIIGHETTGVSKEALALADQIVELPMYGVNKSLNVMVSLAIVLFKSVEQC